MHCKQTKKSHRYTNTCVFSDPWPIVCTILQKENAGKTSKNRSIFLTAHSYKYRLHQEIYLEKIFHLAKGLKQYFIELSKFYTLVTLISMSTRLFIHKKILLTLFFFNYIIRFEVFPQTCLIFTYKRQRKYQYSDP